jgi:hypothetical protein
MKGALTMPFTVADTCAPWQPTPSTASNSLTACIPQQGHCFVFFFAIEPRDMRKQCVMVSFVVEVEAVYVMDMSPPPEVALKRRGQGQ